MSLPSARPTYPPAATPGPTGLLPEAEPKHPRLATPAEVRWFVTAYRALLTAPRQAAAVPLPAPSGAVALARFREMHVPDAIFLWMLYHAHIDHLLPEPRGDGGRGGVRRAASLLLRPASSLVLTEAGSAFARAVIAAAARPGSGGLGRRAAACARATWCPATTNSTACSAGGGTCSSAFARTRGTRRPSWRPPRSWGGRPGSMTRCPRARGRTRRCACTPPSRT